MKSQEFIGEQKSALETMAHRLSQYKTAAAQAKVADQRKIFAFTSLLCQKKIHRQEKKLPMNPTIWMNWFCIEFCYL